jgi:hypothetical protein
MSANLTEEEINTLTSMRDKNATEITVTLNLTEYLKLKYMTNKCRENHNITEPITLTNMSVRSKIGAIGPIGIACHDEAYKTAIYKLKQL